MTDRYRFSTKELKSLTNWASKVVDDYVQSQEDATGLQEEVDAIQEELVIINNDIDALEIAVDQNTSDIAQNTLAIIQNALNIAQNSSDIADIDANISDIDNEIDYSYDARIAALEKKNRELEDQLNSIEVGAPVIVVSDDGGDEMIGLVNALIGEVRALQDIVASLV